MCMARGFIFFNRYEHFMAYLKGSTFSFFAPSLVHVVVAVNVLLSLLRTYVREYAVVVDTVYLCFVCTCRCLAALVFVSTLLLSWAAGGMKV